MIVTIATVVFWSALFLIAYTYVGYPVLLKVLPAIRTPSNITARSERDRSVTMIIAAYNEETFIRAKIENSLAINYPEDLYRIIVVSDGSDDATNTIASEFNDPRLTFIALKERGGKAGALTRALRHTKTDLVLFTDANVFLQPDAAAKLVDVVDAPGVGAATGRVELESMEEKEPLGESAYMRFERLIQALESRFWSVVGVDGGLFIVRRELICDIPADTVLDDFSIGINVALEGSRVCYQPDAVAVEQVPAEVSQEFRRKARIAAGCFQFLSRFDWTAFWRSPAQFKIAFLSHKVIRWYVPLFLILTFCCNLFLLGQPLYSFTLIVQLSFYGLAIAAALSPALRQLRLLYVAYYFTAMNLALIAGWYRHKRDRQSVTWSRVDR